MIRILLFTTLLAVSTSAESATKVSDGQLISPSNCLAVSMECMTYLTWNAPDSLGSNPPGLIGYRVARNDEPIHDIFDPGNTLFYELPDPGIWTYSVQAIYELTPYGNPGDTGYSDPCIMEPVVNSCYHSLPFLETWDQGTFAFNDWRQSGSGNWVISTTEGHPAPAASFTGLPSQTSYSSVIRSPMLAGQPWTCADLLFSFQFRLDDNASNFTESLEAGYQKDNIQHPIVEMISGGSSGGYIGWNIPIDTLAGEAFAIYFKAHGVNSANITRWTIDNISVTATCKPVIEAAYVLNGNTVTLTWDHPCDPGGGNGSPLIGYNVYRTGESGVPPYSLLNSTPLSVQTYTDQLPSTGQNAQYRYAITALFQDEQIQQFLCESPGDTLLVIPGLGISTAQTGRFSISPNPGKDVFRIELTVTPIRLELCDLQGRIIMNLMPPSYGQNLSFDLSGKPAGIYFVRLYTDNGIEVLKLIRY